MDYEASNAAWEGAFKKMEASGYDTSKYKTMDRSKLLPEIQKQYEYSVNNASAIRHRVKEDEELQRKIKLEAERRKTLIDQQRERATAATKPVNSPTAAVGRIIEKYNKDSKSLNDTERNTLRAWYEGNLSKQDEIDYEMAWEAPEREAIRRRHMERIKKLYPDLYPAQPKAIPQVKPRIQFDAQGNPIK
jgi:hypothetical protein